jgi:pimeloyl-ACP methyl ester carboxylesterase
VHTTHFVANGPLATAFHEKGSGHALLMVHGFTGSKLDFHDQLDWFEDLRRVIAFDQRGHGETSNVAPYTFEVMVDDLLRLLDVLDIERCDLLGHSLGGMIALRALLARPDRFTSLILMDTSAAPVRVWPSRTRRALNKLVKRESCMALLERQRDMEPSAAEQRGIDFLGADEHWRRISVKLQQMDAEAFIALGAVLVKHESMVHRLAEIRCPTTIIVGEHDAAFLEPSAVMAAQIAGARLVTIADAAHCPQYENAPAWRAAVREHLLRRGD